MKTNAVFACVVTLFVLGGVVSGYGNLLDNGGFETPGTFSYFAENWEWMNPDTHGSVWGTASRESWRARTGSWEATIRGSWAGDTSGGWWQEKAGIAGASYTLGAWFWNDEGGNAWTSASQCIKIEFIDSGDAIIGGATNEFANVGETWTKVEVSGIAPANCAMVRAVIQASGVGGQGALQFDDATLTAEPGTVILLSSTGLLFMGLTVAVPLVRRKRA